MEGGRRFDKLSANGFGQPELEAELGAQVGLVEVDVLAGEFLGGGVPGEVDHDPAVDGAAGGTVAGPGASVGATHAGDLDDALGADDDVLQVEGDVGEGAEEGLVEQAGAGVALPVLAGGNDDVDAVFGECGEEAGDVALVFGDGVTQPEAADAAVLVGGYFARELFARGVTD